MLNRLRFVLQSDKFVNTPQSVVDLYINAIERYAELGPAVGGPYLTLGGTGVIALRDREDAHVLETALAGQASVLVSNNFKDFKSSDTYIVTPDRHAIHTTPTHVLQIVTSREMMNWLKLGKVPF